MASRSRVDYAEFKRVMDDFVGAGTPINRVTLKMLIDRLGGSNSTHIAFRERYQRENQQHSAIAQLPGTLTATLLAYGDQRAEEVRAELAAEFAQEREATQGLTADLKQTEQDLASAQQRIQELVTENASLRGQALQQATENGELKHAREQLTEQVNSLQRDLSAAQAEVQASTGRVEEIRAAADRQTQQSTDELQRTRDEARDAQRRIADAEKAQAAAEARLEGERRGREALESRVAELQETAARLEAQALRALAADAAAAGLRDNVKVLTSTVDLLRGLVSNPAEGGIAPAASSPPLPRDK